jgi:hypothetical protein
MSVKVHGIGKEKGLVAADVHRKGGGSRNLRDEGRAVVVG